MAKMDAKVPSSTPSSPDVAGNTLSMVLQTPDEDRSLEAEIRKVFKPFTHSCTMLVSIKSEIPKLKGNFILKLLDRRYATQLRQDQRVPPWTPEIEPQYNKFILNGSIIEFLDRIDSVDGELDDDLDDVQNEAFISNMARDIVDNEVDAYKTLEGLQGKKVPRFFGSVKMPSSSDRPYAVSEYTDIRGLLVEYIQGFSLNDLVLKGPKKAWRTIGRKAISTLHDVRIRGIANMNVRAKSFIVNPKNLDVRMINFSQCRFREQCKTEEEWKRVQSGFEEERTIERALETVSNGAFGWQPSVHFRQLQRALGRENTGASFKNKYSTGTTKTVLRKTLEDTMGTTACPKAPAKIIISKDNKPTKAATERLDAENDESPSLGDLHAVPWSFKAPNGHVETDESPKGTSNILAPAKETPPNDEFPSWEADIITSMTKLDLSHGQAHTPVLVGTPSRKD